MRQVLPILRSVGPSHWAKVVFCSVEINDRLQALVRAQAADLIATTHPTELPSQLDEADWGCIVCGDQSVSDDAVDALARFTDERPGFCWILWTSRLNLTDAVTAMQRGAFSVLPYAQDDATLSTLSTSIADAMTLGQERL